MVTRKSVPWHNVKFVKALAPELQLKFFVEHLSPLERRRLLQIIKSALAKEKKRTRKRTKTKHTTH